MINREVKKCIVCLKGFCKPKKYSYQQWCKKVFCTNSCAGIYRTKKVEKDCLFCKNSFYTLPSKIEIGLGKFCSHACSAKVTKNATGHKVSEEHKVKLKKIRTGSTHSEETREKMGRGLKLHYDKIGRKVYKRYIHLTSSKEYKLWRKAVFERDDYTCQGCKLRGCYLEAHHVKSWAKYPESRYEVSNGLTLCKDCHKLTDNYKNKKCVP